MSRQKIWASIRKQYAKNGFFTVQSIRDHISKDISHSAVRVYVGSLNKAGILARDPIQKRKIHLVVDHGLEAPRVRSCGALIKPGSVQENIWRAIRILKRFTPQGLAIAASTDDHPCAIYTARRYCSFLAHAGYLKRDKPHYHAIASRYTGPRPPSIQRSQSVYDPNLEKVVWTKGGDK